MKQFRIRCGRVDLDTVYYYTSLAEAKQEEEGIQIVVDQTLIEVLDEKRGWITAA